MSKDDLLFKISEDIGSIKSEVKNLSQQVKEQGDKITEVHEKTFNIDSWKNGIIEGVIEHKESLQRDIDIRLKPLEDDLKERKAVVKDVKKKVWDITWDWLKIGIVFAAGYLLTIIRKL